VAALTSANGDAEHDLGRAQAMPDEEAEQTHAAVFHRQIPPRYESLVRCRSAAYPSG